MKTTSKNIIHHISALFKINITIHRENASLKSHQSADVREVKSEKNNAINEIEGFHIFLAISWTRALYYWSNLGKSRSLSLCLSLVNVGVCLYPDVRSRNKVKLLFRSHDEWSRKKNHLSDDDTTANVRRSKSKSRAEIASISSVSPQHDWTTPLYIQQ